MGYSFRGKSTATDLAKVETITKIQTPTSAVENKCFLAMSQFNSLFMFGNAETYSDITAPLSSILQKNSVLRWTLECEAAFQEIKEGL